jgi:hypothetical protein
VAGGFADEHAEEPGEEFLHGQTGE